MEFHKAQIVKNQERHSLITVSEKKTPPDSFQSKIRMNNSTQVLYSLEEKHS